MAQSRVLVVDDDSQILRAVRTTLLARGYSVATASSGETALDMLKEDVWDLVLLDLSFPDETEDGPACRGSGDRKSSKDCERGLRFRCWCSPYAMHKPTRCKL